MTQTRDFKHTVMVRAERDREFASALLDEALALILNGDPENAGLILRDLLKPAVEFK